MENINEINFKECNVKELIEFWRDYNNDRIKEYLDILESGNYDAISIIHVALLIKCRDNISGNAGNDSFKTMLTVKTKEALKHIKMTEKQLQSLITIVNMTHEEYKNAGVRTHYYEVNEKINSIINDLTNKYKRKETRVIEEPNATKSILKYIESKNDKFNKNRELVPVENTHNTFICLLSDNDNVPGMTVTETVDKIFHGDIVLDLDGNEFQIIQDKPIWLEVPEELCVKENGNKKYAWSKYEVNQYAIFRNKFTKEPVKHVDTYGRLVFRLEKQLMNPYDLASNVFSYYGLRDILIPFEKSAYIHRYAFKSRKSLPSPDKINFSNAGIFEHNDKNIVFLNRSIFSQAISNIPNQVNLNYNSDKYKKYGYRTLKSNEIVAVENTYREYYADYMNNLEETN